MNFLSNLSTKKNSVNSSLATIKAPKDMNETINKYAQKCNIRFSHQQQQNQQPKGLQRNSSYKENLKFEQYFEDQIVGCMNHESKAATHMVLSDSESPMYYCERCAILIASKGFNVEPIERETDKENRNKLNSKRGSFSQNDNKSNPTRKEPALTHQPTKPLSHTPHQPTKILLSAQIISQLQQSWKGLKSGRQSNLNQIDIYINTLNQNIDFLEDYYYILHQYIEKQKNLQLKDILGKKQLLEQLRAEVSGFYVNSFAGLKDLKERLVRVGECGLEMYQGGIQQAMRQKFSLNFEAAIEEVSAINYQKQLNVHKIGQQMTNLIKHFHLLPQKNSFQPHQKRPSIYKQDLRHTNLANPKPANRPKDQHLKTTFNPQNYPTINPSHLHYEPPHIPGINQAQSSVRSLQLSFDNSENNSVSSPRKEREETNNFTLNQYLNQRGEESYTNLLMTSTDMS